MTFAQFLAILRARIRPAAIVFGVIVGLAILLSLVLPKQYSATASVVIDAKPDPITAMLYSSMPTPAFMATQVDIIQSDRVAFRVVRNLKLTENPDIRAQWQSDTDGQGTIEQWLSDTFQKHMDVKPSRDSNVISVTYKAPDPRFAATLANAFVQAFIETSLELRVDPARQYNSFFDSRAKDARAALEAAQSKLSAYQKEHGIIGSDDRFDVETARLNELSSQLVLIQALSSESQSRQAQARGSSVDKTQEVINNPLIGSLSADISRAEAQLQQLSSRLGDNNPQVVEAKASLKELKLRRDADIARVTSGISVSANINKQREAELRSSLEAQRVKVLRMKAVRDEGSVLVRDLENTQQAFNAITTRLTQSNLESQTTQSNANVLTQATPPYEPSSPKFILNTAAAIVLGAVLAIGLVLVLEATDRRVRSAGDLVDAFSLPVIGTLPGRRRRRLTWTKRSSPSEGRQLVVTGRKTAESGAA